MWIDLSEWAKNTKLFVSLVHVLLRVTSAKDDFNNPLTHALNTSQPPSPATPYSLSLFIGLMNKVTMVWGMDIMHGPSHMHFHSPRLTRLQPLLSAQSARSRDQWSPIWHHSLGWPVSDLVASWLNGTPSIMGGAVFCSYQKRCLLWIWIYIPCMLCFSQNYHMWAYRITYPLSWYST